MVSSKVLLHLLLLLFLFFPQPWVILMSVHFHPPEIHLFFKATQVFFFSPPPPFSLPKEKTMSSNFSKNKQNLTAEWENVSEKELAFQMTLFESELYRKILPNECLSWNKKDKESKALNIWFFFSPFLFLFSSLLFPFLFPFFSLFSFSFLFPFWNFPLSPLLFSYRFS